MYYFGPSKNFNNQLAHYRIIVENLFAAIKKWKICSNVLNIKFTNLNDAVDYHNKLWKIVGYLVNRFHSFGIRN